MERNKMNFRPDWREAGLAQLEREVSPKKGRPSPCRKLSDDQVKAIRASNGPNSVLAKEYGLAVGTISQIRMRRYYRNVK